MKLMFEGELPEHCYDCHIHDPGDGHCQIDGRTSDYRPFWCPLTPVTSTVDSDDAPHEMLAREFVRIWNRLCKSYNTSPCENCPVHEWCTSPLRIAEYKEMETVLVEWAKAHPEKTRKTYKEDFLEKFPEVQMRFDEEHTMSRPVGCRMNIYGIEGPCTGRNCFSCWNEVMEEKNEH